MSGWLTLAIAFLLGSAPVSPTSSSLSQTTSDFCSKERPEKRSVVEEFIFVSICNPGEDRTRFGLLRPVAGHGSPYGQFSFGLVVLKVRDASSEKTVKWLTRAADEHIVEAQYFLGMMYKFGDGVAKDHEIAKEWLSKAAANGDPAAQYNLGRLYDDMAGGPVAEAIEWFAQAADQGHVDAQKVLANRFAYGYAVPEDDETAAMWFTRAAEQGDADAQFNLGVRYAEGDGVPQNDEIAVEWFTKAAEQDHLDSQYNLGAMFYNREGVPADYEVAVAWFGKAAERGHSAAQHALGRAYYYGDGVFEDHEKTIEWWTKAARQGFAAAQYDLGTMYSDGEGVPEDDKMAIELFSLAAEQNAMDAMFALGLMYRNGEGIPSDETRAYTWFKLAADAGHTCIQMADLMQESLTPNQLAEARQLIADWVDKHETKQGGELRGSSTEFRAVLKVVQCSRD